MHWVEMLGYIAAFLIIGAHAVGTMIPLRAIGIGANCFFILYGFLANVYPLLILHAILLPLNAARLHQMLQLVRNVKAASQGDLNAEWLKPFMRTRTTAPDEVIFRKGDLSSAMYYTVTGRYRLVEIGEEIPPGQLIGEVGLIAPDNRRTLTFECVEGGTVLTISYAQVKQLYYQNPKFGFDFLQLISRRLFQDIARLEEREAKRLRLDIARLEEGRVAQSNALPQ